MADRMSKSAGGFLSYFVRHHTIANLVLVLMIAAGVMAIPNMRAQFFPDVVVDDIRITVAWEGAGPEDVDTAIVQVMEPALRGVEGVTATSSTATEGSASFRMEFEPGTDIEKANEDVQLVLDDLRNLPSDAEDPELRRGGWADRVTDVVISGPVGVDQLGRFTDEMVRRLFDEGVTQTIVRGVAAPSTVIEVPSLSLIEFDISMAEIAGRIAEEADADPAGDVSNATRVRTGIAKRSADDIGRTGRSRAASDVAERGDGTTDQHTGRGDYRAFEHPARQRLDGPRTRSDAAVPVPERAYRFLGRGGHSCCDVRGCRFDVCLWAAERAAKRMFSPVFSATITTIIAFFGLVAIGGRFGSLIADIPFTVIVVLAASLVECFLILPHHLSRSMLHSAKDHWYDMPSRVVNRGFDWFRDRIFRSGYGGCDPDPCKPSGAAGAW